MATSEINLPALHAKQQLAYDSEASEILYGGATRGGKSFFVRWALINWCSQIPNLQCDIFRLHFDDVIGNHMEGDAGFPVLLANWAKDKIVTITQTEIRFNFNGSLISLEHCGDDRAMLKHQGIPKHVRVFEEATQISERRIRWLRGWVSMSEDMKAKVPKHLQIEKDGKLINPFPKIIYTANPIGVSAGYFRRTFVKAARKTEVFQAPEEEGGFLRQYIPALVDDNPSEDAIKTRQRMAGIGDSAITDALLNENWDSPIGDFFREYDENKHVVPDFEPPAHWLKYRGFDWGGSDPFAVLWCCVSDGEEFESKNKTLWFPRGALILYREWYGCNSEKPSEGLRMKNEEIAQGILDRTLEKTSGITLTDSLPFKSLGGPTISDIFFNCGVPLIKADTERVKGWSVVRDRLIGVSGFPMIYICESCKYTRDYFPALQRHKTKVEDAVEEGEATHIMDVVRYLCNTFEKVNEAPPSPVLTIESKTPTFDSVFKSHLKKIKKNNDGY
ncbi:MAG: hypothetical protein ACRCSC_01875 [Lactococcus garvieae]